MAKEQFLARFSPNVLSLMMRQKGKLISEKWKGKNSITLQSKGKGVLNTWAKASNGVEPS